MASRSRDAFITNSRETIQLLTRRCYIDLPRTGRARRGRHRPCVCVCVVCGRAAARASRTQE